MHEDDRLLPLRVGAIDLLLFMGRTPLVCRLGQSLRLPRSLFLRQESQSQPGPGKGAPRATVVYARAFNMTKSWMVP